MKLLDRFLPHLLLATVALAGVTPIPDPRPGNDAAVNVTYPNIEPGATVYRYADLMNKPEPEDRFANLAVSIAGESRLGDNLKGTNTAIIRMSTVKQHIGEFAGQRLFDIIHSALLKLCPYERGRTGCYPGMPGSGESSDDNTLASAYKYYNKYYILDVPYRTEGGDYATNAWITITAKAIFRDQKYPGIGAATYEMAAGVYKRATEVPKARHPGFLLNCYTERFNQNSRPYTFCDVPKHVLVALPADQSKATESWLSITVEFNGFTRWNEFDCHNSSSSVIDFWNTAVLPDVTKSMRNSEDDWKTPCTECWEEDKCFTLGGWRLCHTCDHLGWT